MVDLNVRAPQRYNFIFRRDKRTVETDQQLTLAIQSLSVGATFKNQSAADGASSRSDEIAQAAAQVVGSVVPLISMTSGMG